MVDRVCNLLQAHGEQDQKVAAARRWTNREVHLFGVLVPLAAYTEELARELEGLVLAEQQTQRLEARLDHARREMEPVLRQLCLSANALKGFMEELKKGSAVSNPGEVVLGR